MPSTRLWVVKDSDLNNRTIEGVTFDASGFVFLSGFSIADAEGLRLLQGGAGTDLQDIGIVALSVPEPTSASILALGGLAMLMRRRK